MALAPPRSPLEALTRERFGGGVSRRESLFTITTTASRILANNPNRVFWLVMNTSFIPVMVGFSEQLAQFESFVIGVQGGYISASVAEDGELLGEAVFARTTAFDSVARVLEILRI